MKTEGYGKDCRFVEIESFMTDIMPVDAERLSQLNIEEVDRVMARVLKAIKGRGFGKLWISLPRTDFVDYEDEKFIEIFKQWPLHVSRMSIREDGSYCVLIDTEEENND